MLHNDNRKYSYSSGFTENRPEYGLVMNAVPEGAEVLDLACGEGGLIQQLSIKKSCICTGVEISLSGVEICLKKGLNVIQANVDTDLPFETNSFDVVICNVTFQMLMFPETAFQEMIRVSKNDIIISFPNFAYFLNRLEMLLMGRMPKKLLFGYEWYNTGHIHQFSLSDLKKFVTNKSVKIKNVIPMPTRNKLVDILAKIWPNIFGKIIIVHLETV
jgi:methionine biosynthesis protein MetW